jgi:hypothetical protein
LQQKKREWPSGGSIIDEILKRIITLFLSAVWKNKVSQVVEKKKKFFKRIKIFMERLERKKDG